MMHASRDEVSEHSLSDTTSSPDASSDTRLTFPVLFVSEKQRKNVTNALFDFVPRRVYFLLPHSHKSSIRFP